MNAMVCGGVLFLVGMGWSPGVVGDGLAIWLHRLGTSAVPPAGLFRGVGVALALGAARWGGLALLPW